MLHKAEERKRAERVRARTRALPRPPASARLLLLDSSTRTRPSFAHPRFFSPQGKNLVVLMLQHLTNAGYTGSVEALTAESGVSLAQYEVADNVELVSALQAAALAGISDSGSCCTASGFRLTTSRVDEPSASRQC